MWIYWVRFYGFIQFLWFVMGLGVEEMFIQRSGNLVYKTVIMLMKVSTFWLQLPAVRMMYKSWRVMTSSPACCISRLELDRTNMAQKCHSFLHIFISFISGICHMQMLQIEIRSVTVSTRPDGEKEMDREPVFNNELLGSEQPPSKKKNADEMRSKEKPELKTRGLGFKVDLWPKNDFYLFLPPDLVLQ